MYMEVSHWARKDPVKVKGHFQELSLTFVI